MNFQELHSRLVAKGYTDDTADAKIAHDIVLKAINAASFRDNLTIKGGVVMSGITDLIRRTFSKRILTSKLSPTRHPSRCRSIPRSRFSPRNSKVS